MTKNVSALARHARHKKRRTCGIAGSALAITLASGACPAHAQNASKSFLFTNDTGSNNWDTAANWTQLNTSPAAHAVPYGRDSDAVISGMTASKTSGIIYLNSLSLQDAAVLNLYGGINTFAYNIRGGTINLAASGSTEGTLFLNEGTALSGTRVNFGGTVASNLRLFAGTSLTLDNFTTLTGAIGTIGSYNYGDSATVLNNGTIRSTYQGTTYISPTSFTNNGIVSGGGGTRLAFEGGGTITNAAYGNISVSGGTFSTFGNTFTNQNLAQISITGSGVVQNTRFTNNGTMDVTGILTTLGSGGFTNNGTLRIFNGTLQVGSAFTANTDLLLSNSALTLATGGTLLTNNNPLTVTTLTLNGGTIRDSTINATTIQGSTASSLQNVCLSGTIDSSTSFAPVYLTKTSLVGGTLNIRSGSVGADFYDGILYFSGSGADASTLDNMTINFDATYGGSIGLFPGATLTLGAGTVLQGRIGQIGFNYGPNSGSTLINNGTISASGSGDRVFIDPASFTNNGLVEAKDGADISLCFGGVATNTAAGTIQTSGGTGLTVYDNLFTNQGKVVLNDSGMGVIGGIVANSGTITITNGGLGIGKGTLTNTGVVSITNGNFRVVDGATATTGNLTLTNSYLDVSEGATLNLAGTGTLAPTNLNIFGAVNKVNTLSDGKFAIGDSVGVGFNASTNLVNTTMNFSATRNDHFIDSNPGAVVTIDANSTLSGGLGRIGSGHSADPAGSFINNGTVNSTNTGRTSIQTESFTNNKTLQASGSFFFDRSATTNTAGAAVTANAGVTVFGGSFVNDGVVSMTPGRSLTLLNGAVLSGTGTINGNIQNSAGIVSPGNSPGTLTVNGNFRQLSAGTLLVEWGGLQTGQYDFLDISGAAILGGTLKISFLDGFTPNVGDSFTFLTADEGISGFFANTVSSNNSYTYSYSISNNAATVRVTSVSAAPEPGSVVFMGGSLLGVGGLLFTRRRHSRRAAFPSRF